jgi:hypothetical protein
MAIILQDTFTDINGTPLANHIPEVSPNGARWIDVGNRYNIQGNALNTVSAREYTEFDVGTPNFRFSFDIGGPGTNTGGYLRFGVRRVDTDNQIWVAWMNGSNWNLFKSEGGTATTIESATTQNASHLSTSAYVNATFVCEGDTIEVYINNELLFTYTDSFNNTATKIGIAGWSSGHKFDNVLVESLGETEPPPIDEGEDVSYSFPTTQAMYADTGYQISLEQALFQNVSRTNPINQTIFTDQSKSLPLSEIIYSTLNSNWLTQQEVYDEVETNAETKQFVYREVEVNGETQQILFQDKGITGETQQTVYADKTHEYPTVQQLYEEAVVAYETQQQIYRNVEVFAHTLQEILDNGILRTFKYPLQLDIYKDMSQEILLKQEHFREVIGQIDLTQAMYRVIEGSYETNIEIYADLNNPTSTQQVIYGDIEKAFPLHQSIFNPDKTVTDTVTIKGVFDLDAYLKGKRELDIEVQGTRELNVILKGVIRK